MPFAVFPDVAGPRISAVHPHMPFRVSRLACNPLIFTGAGRAFELLPVSGEAFQNATDSYAMRDTDRLLGHAAAARLSAPTTARSSCDGPPVVWRANPAMGFSGPLSGVLDAVFSGTRADARRRATVDR